MNYVTFRFLKQPQKLYCDSTGLHSFPRQLAHPKTNSPSKICATLLFICTNEQVCHRRVCHLSLYFSQQPSVPLPSLQILSFLLSFKVNALVWQGWVCHLVFFFSQQAGVPPFGVPPHFFFLTTSSCATKGGVPADEVNWSILGLISQRSNYSVIRAR